MAGVSTRPSARSVPDFQARRSSFIRLDERVDSCASLRSFPRPKLSVARSGRLNPPTPWPRVDLFLKP